MQVSSRGWRQNKAACFCGSILSRTPTWSETSHQILRLRFCTVSYLLVKIILSGIPEDCHCCVISIVESQTWTMNTKIHYVSAVKKWVRLMRAEFVLFSGSDKAPSGILMEKQSYKIWLFSWFLTLVLNIQSPIISCQTCSSGGHAQHSEMQVAYQ